MAELHVQEKERSVWPWILGAVIVLALLFYLIWGRGDGTNVGMMDDNDSTMVSQAPNSDPNSAMMGSASGTVAGSAVSEYLQFVDARPSRASNRAHDYTADGLRKLSDAISEIVSGDSVGGVALQPRINEIRERADGMQQNANATEHAMQTREAFAVAASLIGQMQDGPRSTRNTTASDNRDALTDAAMTIEPSRPLLDQTDRIEQFFSEAGNALRNMTNTTR